MSTTAPSGLGTIVEVEPELYGISDQGRTIHRFSEQPEPPSGYREYLVARRRALLFELAEIEKQLDIKRKR